VTPATKGPKRNRGSRAIARSSGRADQRYPGPLRASALGSGAREPVTSVISAADAITGIPDSLRDELFARFNDLVRNYRNEHWEAATLNAGKFCEVVYTILRGRADGAYPIRAEKPRDMVQACRVLENVDETIMGGRALRVQIPRAIPAVYEIRNNRGTGHAGAEIDPSKMDAEYVLHACQWMLADLVRAYHRLSPTVARQVVNMLTERMIPLVWVVGDIKRVLDSAMKTRDRVLVLLYATPAPIGESTLREWSEYKKPSRFRDEILSELHTEALIHFDRRSETVIISPLGQRVVESQILRDRALS
jgi:hypothetical protein